MSRQQLIQTLWGENRGKVLLMLCLLVAIASVQLWQGLYLEPQQGKARIELQQLQRDLRSEQQRIAAGGGAQVTSLAEDLKQFYQVVPSQKGLGSFIGRLYSYAGKATIDIAQISYSAKPVKDADLLSYELSFSVSGSYAQIKKFIHLLENSPSILILNRITLGGARTDTAELVNLQLNLQTFFRGGEL